MAHTNMCIGRDCKCRPKATAPAKDRAKDDVVLVMPVGAGGTNAYADVLKVQKALNSVPVQFGGPSVKLKEDGSIGTKTNNAIRNFQQRHFLGSDSRIDVMGKTHAKLSGLQPSKIALLEKAKPHFASAMTCLVAAQASLLSAGVELITGGGKNLALVNKHFDISKSANPAVALAGVSSIYAMIGSFFAKPGGLWGISAFEADPFSDDNGMYSWWGGYYSPGKYTGCQRLDTIYMCPYMHKASSDYWTISIIHEVAHMVGPVSGDQIFDYAYHKPEDPAMKALNPYQKQHNAANFQNFAFEAKTGRNWN